LLPSNGTPNLQRRFPSMYGPCCCFIGIAPPVRHGGTGSE
jgi:hypothetical protein